LVRQILGDFYPERQIKNLAGPERLNMTRLVFG
jgi:hypothetical protein